MQQVIGADTTVGYTSTVPGLALSATTSFVGIFCFSMYSEVSLHTNVRTYVRHHLVKHYMGQCAPAPAHIGGTRCGQRAASAVDSKVGRFG